MTDRAYLDEAIGAKDACRLFGIGPDRFLRRIACLPSFPKPVNRKPMAWIRAEVLEWRESHRDVRAEAIWRLSKKLDVLELARVIGHRDPRSLLLYYSTSADDLADRL